MFKPISFSVLVSGLALASCTSEPELPAIVVPAAVETETVAGQGDAADDPAVWLAPDAAESLILGTDKRSGLYSYSLDGSVHQYLEVGRINNVDVRYSFDMPGPRRDIVLASDRTNIAIAVFLMDPETGMMEVREPIRVEMADPYGFCLYQSSEGALYAFMTDKDVGRLIQYRIYADDEDSISGEEVRRIEVGSISEGCVVDETNGHLYIGEEMVGIWRYGANPGDGDERELFAAAELPAITPDVEGLAIWRREGGDRLVASSQGDSTYAVFDLETTALLGRFAVSGGEIDRTTETDGIEVFAGNLGPAFPEGVFVAQDDVEDTGGQNFKIVDLRDLEVAFAQ